MKRITDELHEKFLEFVKNVVLSDVIHREFKEEAFDLYLQAAESRIKLSGMITISKSQHAEIQRLILIPQKIQAIKFLRAVTQNQMGLMGLKEAKDIVEDSNIFNQF